MQLGIGKRERKGSDDIDRRLQALKGQDNFVSVTSDIAKSTWGQDSLCVCFQAFLESTATV